MKVWDGSTCSAETTWLPPTTMCGFFRENKLLVKRITKSSFAMVEFLIDQFGAFVFEVSFKKRRMMFAGILYNKC